MFSIDEILKFCVKMEELGVDVVQLPDIDIINDTGSNISLHLPFRIENMDTILEHIFPLFCSDVQFKTFLSSVDTTIFGTGERNGIADSITIADYLERNNLETGIDFNGIRKAYNYMRILYSHKWYPYFQFGRGDAEIC